MTAFDGDSSAVSVFFDSDGTEIMIGLDDERHTVFVGQPDYIEIQPEEVPQIVDDLLNAYALRGGDVESLLVEAVERRFQSFDA